MSSLLIALLILVVISNTFMAILYNEIAPITMRPIKWLMFIPPLAWIPVIVLTVYQAFKSIKNNLGK
jgi:TRAP-type C4-dicarboxylate transport system permease small subunit